MRDRRETIRASHKLSRVWSETAIGCISVWPTGSGQCSERGCDATSTRSQNSEEKHHLGVLASPEEAIARDQQADAKAVRRDHSKGIQPMTCYGNRSIQQQDEHQTASKKFQENDVGTVRWGKFEHR
jgi:hypothetical protein